MSNLPKGAKSSGLFNIMADAVSNSKAATTSYILNKDIKIGGSYDEWGNKTIPLQNSNTEYRSCNHTNPGYPECRQISFCSSMDPP